MNLSAIQSALRARGLDGWLFCDHHHRDPMAYRILGLPERSMASRRWFYFVPAEGEPVKLAHRVEPRMLDPLPGKQEHYLAWTELHAKLRAMVARAPRIAMQYSPNNNIPYIGLVDAGTIELVRSFGPEIVTSADLVQQFEAAVGEEGFESHVFAGERVQRIKDETFAAMRESLAGGKAVDEYGLKERIVRRFEEEGLTCDGESPIVGFNDHPADPHFEPVQATSYTLKKGDTVLLDLWARRAEPPGIYYDITWCAFAGDRPPAKYVEIFRVAREARDAALDFVSRRLDAGTPVHGYEVDDACRKVVRDGGYGDAFLHRTGHSIGTSVHGNGANIDNLETKDDRLIVPGTCFSIEPGIYLAGSMAVRTEIDVFVRSSGKAEVVGDRQTELVLLG
ncbi:MAG TPA: M24 family metallopeptidase [Candidatus Polarisedimenticolaceae bacterium]|nr:M24 family metallopeptidase [Candidatus Polarisedimenticolaceae bacterium]